MKITVRSFLLIAGLCAILPSGGTAWAQGNEFSAWLRAQDKAFEARIQQELRDFRLMRVGMNFPERLNATKSIAATSKPPGAAATLHDAMTGEPLESCITPCVLNVNPNQDYIMVMYRRGHVPQAIGVSSKSPPPEMWLGINFIDVTRKQIKCWKDFKASPKVDGDAKECVRIPPLMPPIATKSGHCIMEFDVSNVGRPYNIQAKSCTEDLFAEPSKASIHWWYYTPKVERGQAVTQTGIENKMTFRLSDEDGNLIPELGEEGAD